jgi:hypothetical protein
MRLGIKAQLLKSHQYNCQIKARPANVLNIIRGCLFLVLFWASKKEQSTNAAFYDTGKS